MLRILLIVAIGGGSPALRAEPWTDLSPEPKGAATKDEMAPGASAQATRYNRILRRFRQIEFHPGAAAWLERTDLIDSMDAERERNPSLPPVQVRGSRPSQATTLGAGATPVLRLPYLGFARRQAGVGGIPARVQLVARFGPALLVEDGGWGTWHHRMTLRSRWDPRTWLGAAPLMRLLTRGAGWYFRRDLPDSGRGLALAEWSGEMQIAGAEPWPDPASGRYIYRGPRYLYGKPVAGFASRSEWFLRRLTPRARRDQEVWAQTLRDEFRANWGPRTGPALALAMADSRVQWRYLAPGRIGIEQQLTGKALSEEAVLAASRGGDNPFHYQRRYAFALPELFGRPSGDMRPRTLKLSDPPTVDTLQQAQHELLSGIYRDLERQGAYQVIFRLAPADRHHFAMPFTATPLPRLQIAALLRNRLVERFGGAAKGTALARQELALFERLEQVFAGEEKKLGRPSQNSIDLWGDELLPVAAPAIRNRPRILAQNDRKVMVLGLGGDEYAVAVFIGATGVARIFLDPRGTEFVAGATIGSMQFGEDRHEGIHGFGASDPGTTRDGLPKLEAGAELGRFPLGGSTIILLLPGNRWAPRPEFAGYRHWATYRDPDRGDGYGMIELAMARATPLFEGADLALLRSLHRVGGDSLRQALRHLDEKETDLPPPVAHLLAAMLGKKGRAAPPDLVAGVERSWAFRERRR